MKGTISNQPLLALMFNPRCAEVRSIWSQFRSFSELPANNCLVQQTSCHSVDLHDYKQMVPHEIIVPLLNPEQSVSCCICVSLCQCQSVSVSTIGRMLFDECCVLQTERRSYDLPLHSLSLPTAGHRGLLQGHHGVLLWHR